jgi:hypothetical protein
MPHVQLGDSIVNRLTLSLEESLLSDLEFVAATIVSLTKIQKVIGFVVLLEFLLRLYASAECGYDSALILVFGTNSMILIS